MKITRLIFFSVLCLMSLQFTTAQTNHRVLVPAYLYLNDVINGDTLTPSPGGPFGIRRDSSAVYVLYRDSLYLSRLIIANVGYKVTIVAADGPGYRPYVCLYKGGTNLLPPGQLVNASGDVELRNLVVSGVYEYGTYNSPFDTTFVGGMQGGIVNLKAAGFNITIDSCVLTNCNGNHVRTDGAPKNVKITNTVFANMGFLHRSNLGAGKGIDVRGGSVDTLLVQNCTFVNYQDRVIRHYGSTSAIKYLKFDHNTLVNGMSYHGTLSLGKVLNCNITNNLIVDGFALGNDTDVVRQAEFTDSKELDARNGKARMTWVISDPDTIGRTSTYKIDHNMYVVSDSGQAFYDKYASAGVGGVGDICTWNINSKLGADSVNAFKKTTLTLKNIPMLMTNMMRWYRTPIADGGAGKSKDVTKFEWPKYDYDRRRMDYFDDTLNCSYPTTVAAYTAAVGAYPVGDLNWFPSKKSAWMINAIEKTDVKATSFSLSQNYPNPFNPSTLIKYSILNNAKVKLEVYDMLGSKVATLVNETQSKGEYRVTFDASKLTSGVYVYQLSTPNQILSKKMMLIK